MELRDPNDSLKRRFQYRRAGLAGIERRVLHGVDAISPWELMDLEDIRRLYMTRGDFHPIIDTLGLTWDAIYLECQIRSTGIINRLQPLARRKAGLF